MTYEKLDDTKFKGPLDIERRLGFGHFDRPQIDKCEIRLVWENHTEIYLLENLVYGGDSEKNKLLLRRCRLWEVFVRARYKDVHGKSVVASAKHSFDTFGFWHCENFELFSKTVLRFMLDVVSVSTSALDACLRDPVWR